MKTAIATAFAAAMLASSTFAFAADNSGNNAGNNDMSVGGDQTGSIDGKDRTPTQADIDRCQTAPADDASCVGVPKQ